MSQNAKGKRSIEEEIINELMSLRSYLEERIRELEEESEKLTALFKIVDDAILTKSFKKAEAIPAVLAAPQVSEFQEEVPSEFQEEVPSEFQEEVPSEFQEEVPLKTSTGMLLATIYVGDDMARIVPAEGSSYTENTPPFQQFLVNRILEPMKTKDKENSQKGLIMPNQALSYETITEDDVIKELIIRNYGTRQRLREIISSSRWTFDKMYENIRTSSRV